MFKFLANVFKLAFLCVVVFSGFVIYQMSEESDKKKESSLELIERAKGDSTLALHADPFEIWSLNQQNQFAGDEKYKDKLISIQGRVKDIDAIFSTPVIELDASTNLLNTFATIYLDFEGDKKVLSSILSKIEREQEVKLLCYGKGGPRLQCHSNSFY